MSWVRLDDQHDIHRKVARLSDLAYRIWVSGMAWCHRQRTIGIVPAGDEALIVPGRKPKEVARAVEELTACGLWHKTEGGHVYHDWQAYQPAPAATASERGKAGAAKRWGHSQGPIATIAKPVSHDANALANDAPDPDPDPDPDPIPPTPTSESGSAVVPPRSTEVVVVSDGEFQIDRGWKPEREDWDAAFALPIPEPCRLVLVRRFTAHHLAGDARSAAEWRRSFRHWAPRIWNERGAEIRAESRAPSGASYLEQAAAAETREF